MLAKKDSHIIAIEAHYHTSPHQHERQRKNMTIIIWGSYMDSRENSTRQTKLRRNIVKYREFK